MAGALVSGPNLQDHYNDNRENYRGTEVAIDYQTGLIALLASVLQLPASFWQGGDLSELANMCTDNFYPHYPWQ